MKRTAFFDRLHNGPFIYREDLGGLCAICNQYGYEVFYDLSNLVIKEIEDIEKQVKI